MSAPQYIFLISELAGERRFASTAAKRLESLGALTHGDRRATESRDLSQFNIENKVGVGLTYYGLWFFVKLIFFLCSTVALRSSTSCAPSLPSNRRWWRHRRRTKATSSRTLVWVLLVLDCSAFRLTATVHSRKVQLKSNVMATHRFSPCKYGSLFCFQATTA